MRIGSIVLHYRFWPGIRATVDSLLEQTFRPDTVIVVDNHSDDGTASEIRAAYPSLELLEMPHNDGYAAGMNAGIRTLLRRDVDAILLLTHECRLAPNALELLAARLNEDVTVGAIGPLLGFVSRPESVFSAGGDIYPWGTKHRRQPGRIDEWAQRSPNRVECLDGAALLLRVSAVRAAGLLDEGYFMYFEETEYLLRLQRLGWVVECQPAAVAWQEPGIRPVYLWERNRLRFLARNASAWTVSREVARLAVRTVRDRAIGRSESAWTDPRARALRDFLMRRWGPDRFDGIGPTNSPRRFDKARESL
jgi:GT2 family glycosyltransferase